MTVESGANCLPRICPADNLSKPTNAVGSNECGNEGRGKKDKADKLLQVASRRSLCAKAVNLLAATATFVVCFHCA